MSHLTLEGSFDPLPHGRWVVTSENILPSTRRFRKCSFPSNARESEGPCSSAGEKAGWPPGRSSARRQHKPRKDAERKGTLSPAWFPSSRLRIRNLQLRPQHAAVAGEFVH
jgi:hypothetical protein